VSLSRAEREGLEVAGFALAEGIVRATQATQLGAALVVRHGTTMQCIPLETTSDPMTRVTAMLQTLGSGVADAAFLEEQEHAGQRTIQVSAWVDGEWRCRIALPFRAGHPLHVRPERIIGDWSIKADVAQVLDAVYSGVSNHPDGLRAWVNAVVDV
jgi:hypothetical protein